APLHDAFVEWGYPFEKRKKQGFAAAANMISDHASVLWRYNAHPPPACGLPPVTPNSVAWCSGPSTGGRLHCETRCTGNQTPAADTLRCGLHGAWVGRLVCREDGLPADDGDKAALLSTLWSKEGSRPPVVMDRAIAG
ncbi:unnamed protein product, partial [Polarella glacialis]